MKKRWLVLLLPVWMCFSSVKAQYYTISNYETHITITPEGYADIVETITAQFEQPQHGIKRAITYRNKVNDQEVDVLIDDVKMDGFKYSTSKDGNNNLVIKIGDADTYVNGTQVYKIHYRLVNPIFFFPDNDELQISVLGN